VSRLALLLILLAACRPAPAGSALTGADSPRSAVEQFLAAAQAGDIQALTAVWGDEQGLARDREPREVIDQRAMIMICILRHDTQRIGAPQPAAGGRMTVPVDLTQGSNSASPPFTVAKGQSNRWYVTNLDLQLLQNRGFCRR
jgi:hypothetical protein